MFGVYVKIKDKTMSTKFGERQISHVMIFSGTKKDCEDHLDNMENNGIKQEVIIKEIK